MATDDKILDKILENLIPDGISYDFKVFDGTLSGDNLIKFRAQFPLSKIELQDIQYAVPKREIEYRTGRYLIKKLLGIHPLDTQTYLYKKQNGALNWPTGIVGSISHSGSTCIAALASIEHFSGIGIDIEQGNLELSLEKIIAPNNELSMCPGCLPYLATLRVLFCCKEAIYKSLEKYLIEKLDFKDVVVQFLEPIDANIFQFNFRFTRSIPGLEIFNCNRFYGKVYANEALAASVVALKSNTS